MRTATITQKGQITIPKRYRDAFGWTQHTDLTFVEEADGVKIITAKERTTEIVEAMQEVDWQGPTSDELMKESRAEKLP